MTQKWRKQWKSDAGDEVAQLTKKWCKSEAGGGKVEQVMSKWRMWMWRRSDAANGKVTLVTQKWRRRRRRDGGDGEVTQEEEMWRKWRRSDAGEGKVTQVTEKCCRSDAEVKQVFQKLHKLKKWRSDECCAQWCYSAVTHKGDDAASKQGQRGEETIIQTSTRRKSQQIHTNEENKYK